jgi:hypothetical protein
MAGYSTTPLAAKLGLRPNQRVLLLNPPEPYLLRLGAALAEADTQPGLTENLELVHLFTTDEQELRDQLPELLTHLADRGCIWVSWPKKSTGIYSQVDENFIRTVALPLGLVDIKVCAVDAIWSGLKLVRRKGTT